MERGEIEFFDTDDIGTSTENEQPQGGVEVSKNIDIVKDELEDEIVDFGELTDDNDENKNVTTESNDPLIAEGENTSTSSSPDNSIYLNLAKALSEKGVINDFKGDVFNDEEKSSTDILMGLLQKTVDDNINEYKSQFNDDTQGLINAIEKGLPIDNFIKAKNKEIEYKNINEEALSDDDNEQLRKRVLTDFYKNTTSFSESRIEKEIRRIIDLGEDVDESKEALVKLQSIAKETADAELKAQEAAREKLNQDYINSMENLRKQVDEIDLAFLGSNPTKKARDRYYNLLTKPVGEVNGRSINAIAQKRNEIGGEKFDIILAALMDKGVFDGDLSKLSSKQRRNAIEDLQRSIEDNRTSFSGSGGRNSSTYDESADSIFSRKR